MDRLGPAEDMPIVPVAELVEVKIDGPVLPAADIDIGVTAEMVLASVSTEAVVGEGTFVTGLVRILVYDAEAINAEVATLVDCVVARIIVELGTVAVAAAVIVDALADGKVGLEEVVPVDIDCWVIELAEETVTEAAGTVVEAVESSAFDEIKVDDVGWWVLELAEEKPVKLDVVG